jgi:hypothetical protein
MNPNVWFSVVPRVLGRDYEVQHFHFRDQHKENDEWVKDFKSGCCSNIIFDSLGVLMWVCNVVILKREYMLDSGSFGDFGNKGTLCSV